MCLHLFQNYCILLKRLSVWFSCWEGSQWTGGPLIHCYIEQFCLGHDKLDMSYRGGLLVQVRDMAATHRLHCTSNYSWMFIVPFTVSNLGTRLTYPVRLTSKKRVTDGLPPRTSTDSTRRLLLIGLTSGAAHDSRRVTSGVLFWGWAEPCSHQPTMENQWLRQSVMINRNLSGNPYWTFVYIAPVNLYKCATRGSC